MLTQFKSLSLKDQSAMLKTLRAAYTEARGQSKADRAVKRAIRAEDKAAKQAASIEKAKARLEKLLAKQVGAVGAKAVKANRKPSKGVTFGAEDNAIAANIVARKAAKLPATA
jgi:hypothetical protein